MNILFIIIQLLLFNYYYSIIIIQFFSYIIIINFLSNHRLKTVFFNLCWQNNIDTLLPYTPFIRNHFLAVIFNHCLPFGKSLNIEDGV